MQTDEISRILKEKMSGKNAGEIGLNFHYTLIKSIEKISDPSHNLSIDYF